jgi:hypothetical protein
MTGPGYRGRRGQRLRFFCLPKTAIFMAWPLEWHLLALDSTFKSRFIYQKRQRELLRLVGWVLILAAAGFLF